MTDEALTTFWVDRSTGTFADLLTAYGFAELMHGITGGDVTIDNVGPCLQLQLERPLSQGQLESVVGLDLLRFIETRKALRPNGVPAINYDEEKQVESDYINARKALSKSMARASPDEQENLSPPPDPDLPLWKVVNQMSALVAHNEIVRRWHEDQAHWPAYLQILTHLFSRHPNDVARAEAEWKAMAKREGIEGKARVTATQVLNPTMGKGGDAPKANTPVPGNKDYFWLIEYLKFVGASVGSIPVLIRTSDPRTFNRKTYVPIPVRVTLGAHKRILAALRSNLWTNTAISMDVLAALGYARTFLEQWLAGNDVELRVLTPDPGNFVSGLAMAFYKNMGSAFALLGLAHVRLSDWMAATTPEDARRYLALLDEHLGIVRRLDEKHSDEYHLLQLYRDFLSGHDLNPFYDFAADYAHTLMSRLERGEYAPQFTTQNLEVLIMGHDDGQKTLKKIIENQGLRSVATAIRLSTIVPQGQKARKSRPIYDVRYGLGDELKRKAAYADELAQAIGDFVQSYNQETVQVLERTGQQRRKMVTDEDLDGLLTLLGECDSKTVGSLLIAYGYARTAQPGDKKAAEAVGEDSTFQSTSDEEFVEPNDSMDVDGEDNA